MGKMDHGILFLLSLVMLLLFLILQMKICACFVLWCSPNPWKRRIEESDDTLRYRINVHQKHVYTESLIPDNKKMVLPSLKDPGP